MRANDNTVRWLTQRPVVYLISYGCSVSVSGPAAFRIAWGVQAVPGVILGIAMFFFPESPRWLASRTSHHPRPASQNLNKAKDLVLT